MRLFIFATFLLLTLVGCASNSTQGQSLESDSDNTGLSTPAVESTDNFSAPSKAVLAVDYGVPENSSGRIQLGAADKLGIGLNTYIPVQVYMESPEEAYTRLFAPRQEAGFPSGMSLAYMGYCFDVSGYIDDLAFTFNWVEDPPQSGSLYLGFADFNRDAWVWFLPEDSTQFTLPTRQPYLNEQDELYLIVMVLNEEAELGWIRIGGNVPPFTGLRLEGTSTPRGQVVLDSFWGCFDADGELASLEFDLDGNGTYETPSGESCFMSTVIETVGMQAIGIRAIDDEGLAGTGIQFVDVNNWQSEVVTEGYIPYTSIDSFDNLHILFTGSGHKQYAVMSGSTWQIAQLPTSYDDHYVRDFILDENNAPYFVSSNDTGFHITRMQHDTWEEACPVLNDAFPDFGRSFLEIDTNGLVHFCAGSELPSNVGIPGIPFDYEMSYWFCDGTNWEKRLNIPIQNHFYGFNLGSDHNTPQFAAMLGDNMESNPVHAVYNSATDEWEQQTISDYGAYFSSFTTAQGKNYIIDWVQPRLFIQDGSTWQTLDAPDLDWSTDGAFAVDNSGTVHVVFQIESWDYYTDHSHTLMYCTYSNGSWDTQTLLASQISALENLSLHVGLDNTVHIVCRAMVNGGKHPSASYGGELPAIRIMHYWR